eukprot:17141-Heterococcus_DN1.PRE.1
MADSATVTAATSTNDTSAADNSAVGDAVAITGADTGGSDAAAASTAAVEAPAASASVTEEELQIDSYRTARFKVLAHVSSSHVITHQKSGRVRGLFQTTVLTQTAAVAACQYYVVGLHTICCNSVVVGFTSAHVTSLNIAEQQRYHTSSEQQAHLSQFEHSRKGQ